MKPKDLENLLAVIKKMAKAELFLAEFYDSCASTWEEDRRFWHGLASSERGHAMNLSKMADIVARKYEHGVFEISRSFNVAALETFIKNVVSNIDRLKQGAITKKKAYMLARDYENSLVEKKYHEIVKTDDIEFQELAKKISLQTDVHFRVIEERIAALKD